MFYRKDIVDPKVEARNAHKKEVKISRNSYSSTHSQNSFTPNEILKRSSNPPIPSEQKKAASPTQKKSKVNPTYVRNTSPRTVSSVFIAKSDDTTFIKKTETC